MVSDFQDPEWSSLGVSVKLNYSIFQVLSGINYTFRSVVISDGENVKVISYIPENLKNVPKFSIFLRTMNALEVNGLSKVSYEDMNDKNMEFLKRLVNLDGVIITKVFSNNAGFHIHCKFPSFLKPEISQMMIEACTSIPELQIEHLTDLKRFDTFFIREIDGEVYRMEVQLSSDDVKECEGEIEADNLRMDRVILIGKLSCNSVPKYLTMEKNIGCLEKYQLNGSLAAVLLRMVREDVLTYKRSIRIENGKIALEIVTTKNNVNTILNVISDVDKDNIEILSINKVQ